MNNIEKAINTWRERHGLSQQDIAVLVGVSLPTAGNWCRGSATPSLGQIGKLEEAHPGLVELMFGSLDRLEATFNAGMEAGRAAERRLAEASGPEALGRRGETE